MSRITITKQHALTMRGVLLWLEQQPAPNQLEIDVLTEIVERVEVFARSGALVRIRVKNLGAPPSRRSPRVWRDGRSELSDADRDALRRMYAEGVRVEEIGERLGRSPGTVKQVIARLQLTRTKPRPRPGFERARTPLQRARIVLAERQRRAGRA